MNYRIKIAFIIDSINAVSGTEKQLLSTIQLLDKTIFEPVLFCLRPPIVPTDINCLGTDYIELKIYSLISLRGFLNIIKLAYELKNGKFDIVITYFVDSSIVGVVASKMARIKKIICWRRDLGFWYTAIILRVLRPLNKFVDKFLVNSESVKIHISEYENIPLDKIDVVYNGVDSSLFRQIYNSHTLRQKYGLKDCEYVVGIAANFSRPVKRVDIFIKAAAAVHKKIPNVKFMILGGGYLREDLERLAISLNIVKYVIFTGLVENIAPVLSVWDVGVISSDSEGFSNSILEYMAAGLPVVATNVGGNSELVKDGASGFLVPPDDYLALAEKIVYLLSDPKLREKMGKEGLCIVRKKFAWDKKIKEIEQYYCQILHGN